MEDKQLLVYVPEEVKMKLKIKALENKKTLSIFINEILKAAIDQ